MGGPARVGIGMSGSAIYSAPAEPNVDLVFTPHPGRQFWVTAGTFQAGTNLDVEQIVAPVKIEFPPDVFAMRVVLDRDGAWSVSPATA